MSRYFLFVSIILSFALNGFCAGSPVPGGDEYVSQPWQPARGLQMIKIFNLDGGPPSPGGMWSSRARHPYSHLREEYEERTRRLPELVAEERESDVYLTPPEALSPVRRHPAKPRIIGSFSGGGIKGLLSAAAVRSICEESDVAFDGLFDATGGTSIGSFLAAIGAGYSEMSAEDCVNLFMKEGHTIFPPSRWNKFISLGGFAAPVYPRKPLDDILLRNFGTKKLSEGKIPFSAVSVLQYQDPHGFWGKPVAKVFNQLEALGNPILDTEVRHALAASSAAPSYFRSPEWDYAGKRARAMDGALVANSPDNEVLLSAREHYGTLGEKDIVLLFRTGHLDPKLAKAPGFVTRVLNRFSPFRQGGLYEHAGSVFHSFMDTGLAEANARRLAISMGVQQENIFTFDAILSDSDMARVDDDFLQELEEKGAASVTSMRHEDKSRLFEAIRKRAEIGEDEV
tara:strand:+ start:21952 stop:23316 length:1365 start_codon:yes stop_codon:yes gene_type:complete